MCKAKTVVLLSGGVDSTVCLAHAVEFLGAENVVALSIYYGQRHHKEIASAAAVAEYYGVEHIIKYMDDVFAQSNCSLLSHSTKDVEHGPYEAQIDLSGENKPVATYVPFRNGLFLAMAASIALSVDAGHLAYGAHKDDATGAAYPDCSKEFASYMKQAILHGSGHQLAMITPLIDKNKTEVVQMGLELNAPFHLTWSCYVGKDEPCGVCATCIDRARAFKHVGVPDPAINKK